MAMILDEAGVVHSHTTNPDRVYKNDGNVPLIDLLDPGVGRILDVGCGAGDNANLVNSRHPNCEIHGITYSATEADIARKRMTSCQVWDIESEIPDDLNAMRFDAIIFSHVLEHLRDPGSVVNSLSQLLRSRGTVLIAVPNTLSWATRLRFLRGDFEYQSSGVLDDTHLRFFTYLTADRYLLVKSPHLKLVSKSVTGSVPLWLLRRHILPRNWSTFIDKLGCRLWPNLFGDQVLLKAVHEQPIVSTSIIQTLEAKRT
jgi:2-polyprenyl-3-methyl-5-hydroxy-6-metoxy-1,4-benzoquinol methylase